MDLLDNLLRSSYGSQPVAATESNVLSYDDIQIQIEESSQKVARSKSELYGHTVRR